MFGIPVQVADDNEIADLASKEAVLYVCMRADADFSMHPSEIIDRSVTTMCAHCAAFIIYDPVNCPRAAQLTMVCFDCKPADFYIVTNARTVDDVYRAAFRL